MAECPLCKGEGRSIHVVMNPHTNLKKAVVEWCLCMKSRYISDGVTMLKWLGDTYMPLEEIDKSLVFNPDPDKLKRCPNLLIQNTDFESFCLHMKSVLMKYRFRDPIPSLYLCKAFDILKKFYVEQPDGANVSLHDLNKYDLLIFTMDTYQKNDQLNTCISEVVHNRLAACIPTWIWLPKGVPLGNTRETSDELKSMLKPDSKDEGDKYRKVELEEKTFEIKQSKNKVQRKAEGFRL